MSLRHRCAQCGASCQGLRVRVRPGERERIAEYAAALGIAEPFAGSWIRQNWGTCVFWENGCRLHAEWGAEAKPATCRQFPFVFAGDAVAIDPACMHAAPDPTGDAPLARVPVGGPPTDPPALDWGDLAAGRAVAQQLAQLPLAALLDGPRLGSLTRELLRGLIGARPAPPSGETRRLLDARAKTALSFGLVPSGPETVVGGGQLITGAELPVGPAFAAWMRLLRTGVL